jgi:hypothetical protein
MSINIIYDYPKTSLIHRFLGQIVSFISLIVILSGLLLTIPLILFIFLVIASFIWDFDLPSFNEAYQMYLIIEFSPLISFVFLFFGHKLMRGKRWTILFLRHFGFNDATEAITFALGSAIGKSCRLVTLDDYQVESKGVKRGIRWFWRMLGVATILIVGTGLYWLFAGPAENYITGMWSGATGIVEILFTAFIIIIVIASIIFFISMPTAFFASVGLLSLAINNSVLQAERSKALSIVEERDIEPTILSISRRGQGIFSPRLTVVSVASIIWKQVVKRIALQAYTVVIDISQPTDNLLWEIEVMKSRFKSRWILVGESGHLSNMNSTNTKQLSKIDQQLLKHLDRECVLAYRKGKPGMKLFAQALQRKLSSL